jgi:hypothetical protein
MPSVQSDRVVLVPDPGPAPLPPRRCHQHAHSLYATPCGACMRAERARLDAHNAASVSAARAWQHRARATLVSTSRMEPTVS